MKIKDQGFMNNSFLMFQIQNYIPPKNIYNLFSNFGNISFIKISKGKVYIKFRSIEFAAMAKNYLNDYKLMQNVLKLETISDVFEASPK
jgi:RNA recognition motif-containing protein